MPASHGTPAERPKVAPLPRALEEAREEADISAKIMAEQASLLEEATMFRLMCPRRETDKDSGPSSSSIGKKDKDGSEAAGGAGKSEPATYCGPRGRCRYATALDMFFYVVGFFFAVVNAAVMPMFSVAIGDLADALVQDNPAALTSAMDTVALIFVAIGAGGFIASFFQKAMLNIAAERQLKIVREEYMRALLRQDIAYFETEQDPAEVATKLTEDTLTMKKGMDENVGMVIQYCGAGIVGLAVGMVYSWDLCLVLFALFPILAGPTVILANATKAGESLESRAYARSGAVASEAISNIRTVIAFNGQVAEDKRYSKHLSFAETIVARTGQAVSIGAGLLYGLSLAAYSVAVVYGAHRIRQSREENPLCTFASSAEIGTPTETCYTVGTMLTALFAVLIGSSVIGFAGPSIAGLGASASAAGRLFDVIDRTPAIDASSEEGYIPSSGRFEGKIELKDVVFSYPSNKEFNVLNGVSITIEPGKTLALVGESGSGKSTIVQLLLRFYDVDSGHILIDGRDIREYNVAWLRHNVGLVSQEPALFATSIEENIAMGLPAYRAGPPEHPGAPPSLSAEVQEQVLAAAKAASVHDFAVKLPSGYKTRSGERGGQLSGGQKQRVAIARALIRKPSIFIGDEATSALDSKSEAEVKQAMDKLLSGKEGLTRPTSLLIAHRISTITNADRIICLADGRVIESGTHEELMGREGVYAGLAAGQGIGPVSPSSVLVTSAAAAGATSSEADLDPAATTTTAAASAETVGKGEEEGEAVAVRTPLSRRVAVRRAAALSAPAAVPLESLFFVVLKGAVKSADDSGEADARLSVAEPRVLLFQSCFLEMAESEQAALLAWWAGKTLQQVHEAAAAINDSPASLTSALSMLSAEGAKTAAPPLVLQAESEAMLAAAKQASTSIVDAKPEVDSKKHILYLAPASSRNSMLGLVLSASRPPVPFSRLWQYQKQDVCLVVVGCLGAVFQGLIMPSYALGLADMTVALYRTGDAFEEAVVFYSIFFLIIGTLGGVAAWVGSSVFTDLGGKLTTRLRRAAFHALMRQEVAFFDLPFNGSGQLTARLAADASLIKAVASERMAVVLSGIIAMIAGIVIAFEASWQLSFVVLAVVPLLAVAGVIEMQYAIGMGQESKSSMETSARVAAEAMTNVRTVTAMGLQPHMQRSFDATLIKPYAGAIRSAIVGGLALGFSQMINYGVVFAFIFWVGSRFLVDGIIQDPSDVFRAFYGLAFGAMGASQGSAMAGNIGKAESAARSIIALIDRTPRMPSPLPREDGITGAPASAASERQSDEPVVVAVGSSNASTDRAGSSTVASADAPAAAAVGAEPGPASASDPAPSVLLPCIEFRNVTFSYPARPESEALSDFSAKFDAGSSVGIVGPSGSGKSTIVQLLLRFYDPDDGVILVNGKDIRELDVAQLRDHQGLVQQEPVLWSDSLMYNIAYGSRGMQKLLPQLGVETEAMTPSSTRKAVEEAARAAFAHEFITTKTPMGYTSLAGAQTTSRLSGGQKQRVAIARALIRKPSIFIGDEATSALDTQSEKEVQVTLDALVTGKSAEDDSQTSILVAHRLATIRNAGSIAVLSEGRLKELGSHDELMEAGGLYASLATAQQIASRSTTGTETGSPTTDDDDDA